MAGWFIGSSAWWSLGLLGELVCSWAAVLLRSVSPEEKKEKKKEAVQTKPKHLIS